MLCSSRIGLTDVVRLSSLREARFPLAYGVLSLPLTVSILLAARKITLGHVYYSVSELLWVLNSTSPLPIRCLISPVSAP